MKEAEPGSVKHQNRLAGEKSPYLLQHAENPVDWYPWGDEAFERAKTENKPIFLSIGYSTCHWCHVMTHESFDDSYVAKLMNDAFVSIKVDREERSDIDSVYMTVCQMLTGRGGWPLTIFMTPDKKPFFAGTYFPKESRFGYVGMIDLLPGIKEIWEKRHDEAIRSANQIAEKLQAAFQNPRGSQLGKSDLNKAYGQLLRSFDNVSGGFGDSPKFPTPHTLFFLLRYWKRSKDDQALAMVEKTLQAMRRGGIYDHVGFGFHRYSVDREWRVPHFEKMLYDQAMIAMACIETFQATGKEEYAKTAREVFSYVLRDLTDPQGGGFYASEDADSEGEEGRFYLWKAEEISQILPAKDAEWISPIFSIEKDGNFIEEATGQRSGKNIFFLSVDSWRNLDPERFEPIRKKLFWAREKRVRPHRDDKILTDWNGLMIAALAKGGQALNEPEYVVRAKNAAGFILSKLQDSNKRLLHRYRDGEGVISGNLNDYAFLIWGLIELYEATFDEEFLWIALDLNGKMLDHFLDKENGGFYLTADDSEEVLVRLKEIYDGAVPSGNSVGKLNLLRLSRMTGNAELEKIASETACAFSEQVSQAPAGYTQLLCAVDFAIGPSFEVVVSGNLKEKAVQAMIKALRKPFLPNKVILFRHEANPGQLALLAPFTKELSNKRGNVAAYVCSSQRCQLPITSPRELSDFLE